MHAFTPQIQKFVLTASSKALATIGTNDLNVVPVSTIQIRDDQVWLFDYFMNKTAQNIKLNSKVSLVCWSGFEGYQLKGQATYCENGDHFLAAKEYVQTIHPERTLKGLIVVEVVEVCDVSVG